MRWQVSSLAKDLQPKGSGDQGLLHEVTLENLRNVLMVVTAEHVRPFVEPSSPFHLTMLLHHWSSLSFARTHVPRQILEDVGVKTQKDMWGLTWAVIDAVCPEVRPTLASFGPASPLPPSSSAPPTADGDAPSGESAPSGSSSSAPAPSGSVDQPSAPGGGGEEVAPDPIPATPATESAPKSSPPEPRAEAVVGTGES